MTVYTDNPAGRLYQLLADFHKRRPDTPLPTAWAGVLRMSLAELSDFMARMAPVFRLPDEIETEIGKIESSEYDRDLAMRWHGRVSEGLSRIFTGQQAGQVAALFDRESLASLEYCSYVLHQYRPQTTFADSDLDRILTLIRELRGEVRQDPGMDPALRDFLLRHADEMERALEDLAVRGPAALEDAFDHAYGAAMRRTDLTAKSEASRGAWRKFGELVVAVAAVLQIATAGIALPGQVRQEIEGPPPPAQVQVPQQAPAASSDTEEPNGISGPAEKESAPSPLH